ncbi:MAG: LptF/LptG family permease [Fimbriimonadaceae bacterium]|nr:LptF/LptG family permease [Fimbriimonadaceae bacterium]
MKTLDRYVIRELFVPFLIGTITVVLMFQANMLIFQYKTFSLNTIPILASLKVILFETPGFLNMTLPVGTSLAVSLAVTRLARETELTAMRSAGASIRRVIMPMVFFGFLVSIGNFFLAENVMPAAKKASLKIQRDIGALGGTPDFKSNVVVNVRTYTVNVGVVQRTQDGGLVLKDILMFERPRVDEVWLYRADSGTYKDGIWGEFKNLKLWTIKGSSLRIFDPKEFVIEEPITLDAIFSPPTNEELTLKELQGMVADGKKAGVDTTSVEVNLHTRFSVPAACLIFSLVAPIFAVLFARGGTFIGVMLSLVLVMLYYNAYIISTEILGKQGIVSPMIAAWLPNIVFLVLGLLALRRIE